MIMDVITGTDLEKLAARGEFDHAIPHLNELGELAWDKKHVSWLALRYVDNEIIETDSSYTALEFLAGAEVKR
jgi:hypothetical protein